ncbi:hypothetical protein Nepgr_029323 [Nepenthes gracilis]|uniref:Uncharacterized protein n=1 Tax=Nepenthes gracilis TaxID=150966 RepID=A0AAD3Y4R3_NEPGR|nr:hypothetical protein Nepgr_029323 [Nepenthes gracilis]
MGVGGVAAPLPALFVSLGGLFRFCLSSSRKPLKGYQWSQGEREKDLVVCQRRCLNSSADPAVASSFRYCIPMGMPFSVVSYLGVVSKEQ